MRKAQVQIGESVAIVIILMILIVMGLVFYFQFQKGSMGKQVSDTFYKKSVSVAQSITNMPELVCSVKGEIIKNCIDEEKMFAFRDLLNDEDVDDEFKDYYFDIFGFSRITIVQVFPVVSGAGRYSKPIYDRSLDDFTEAPEYQIPVLIFKGGVGAKELSLIHI